MQEEKQARFQQEARISPRGAHAWQDACGGSGAYALPHPVAAARPHRSARRDFYGGDGGSVASTRSGVSTRSGAGVSSARGIDRYRWQPGAASSASGRRSGLSQGLAEVNARLRKLETTLEDEKDGRRAVQGELRQLRRLLSQRLPQDGRAPHPPQGYSARGSSAGRSSVFTDASRQSRLPSELLDGGGLPRLV